MNKLIMGQEVSLRQLIAAGMRATLYGKYL